VTRLARTVVALLAAVAPLRAVTAAGQERPEGIEPQLTLARDLYQHARFAEAIAVLQSAVRALEAQRETQARATTLGDAYLHLALAQLGAGERGEAKDAFRRLVRLDPTRALDPDVYAPKVLALLAEARAEVEEERRRAAAASPARPHRSAATTPLIAGGVASAAGVAIALYAGQEPPATPPPPAVSGTAIDFASSRPPSGSEIRLSSRPALVLNLWLIHKDGGEFQISVNEVADPGTSRNCLTALTTVSLRALEPKLVSFGLNAPAVSAGTECFRSPFQITGLEVWMRTPQLESVAYRQLPTRYSVIP
jgi:tetratricopeptide (TPR) repeat protein